MFASARTLSRKACEIQGHLDELNKHYEHLSKLQGDAMASSDPRSLDKSIKEVMAEEVMAEVTKRDVAMNNCIVRAKPSLLVYVGVSGEGGERRSHITGVDFALGVNSWVFEPLLALNRTPKQSGLMGSAYALCYLKGNRFLGTSTLLGASCLI